MTQLLLPTAVAYRLRTECTLRINGDQASLKKTMTTEVLGMASRSYLMLLHSGILQRWVGMRVDRGRSLVVMLRVTCMHACASPVFNRQSAVSAPEVRHLPI